MTDYAKITSRILFGQNSDLSYPELDSRTIAYAPVPTKYDRLQVATSTAYKTIYLNSNFTTIESIIVVNKSTTATEKVLIGYAELLSTKTFGAGDTCTLTGAAAFDTMVANSGAGSFITTYAAEFASHVVITGSATSGNNSTWKIHSVSDESTVVFTSNAGQTPKITTDAANASIVAKFVSYNSETIPAGGHIVLPSAGIMPSIQLTVRSLSGTPEIDIYILGT